MDCGSLLPPESPGARNALGWLTIESSLALLHLGTLDGQQAGFPKAAAGCRSPWGFARFQGVLLRWRRKITRQPDVTFTKAGRFFVAMEELFHIGHLPERAMFGG